MEKGTNKNEAQNNDLKIELYPKKNLDINLLDHL